MTGDSGEYFDNLSHTHIPKNPSIQYALDHDGIIVLCPIVPQTPFPGVTVPSKQASKQYGIDPSTNPKNAATTLIAGTIYTDKR